MDPLTISAEIATILSAAETLPSVQRRRSSRKERQAVYLAYQREAYRLMSGINHLSVLSQIKTITWREIGCVIIPMIDPFVEFVQPAEPSSYALVRNALEMMQGATKLAKAVTPLASSAVESARQSDIELRNQALIDVAVVRDITADFMAALAAVRLIGRPCPFAAADVIRSLFHDLIGKIPTQDQRSIYLRLLARKQDKSAQVDEFAYRISALNEAFSQFHSAIQIDHLERSHAWQIWRKNACEINSAKDLLASARKTGGS